jgi:peptidoglycan/LPS O-acetylase OafA/YrhL
MQLVRTGSIWSFPAKQIRAVPKIIISFPGNSLPSHYQVYLSTDLNPTPKPFNQESKNNWVRMGLVAEGADALSLRLDAPVSKSWVLSVLDRDCVNWKGDFRFLAMPAIVPLTVCGFPWLLLTGFLWFRSAIKERPSRNVRCGAGTKLRRVEGVDHLRGVAILAVYAFHCLSATFGYDQWPWNGWFREINLPSTTFMAIAPAAFGFGGVAVFFAVSGFCIHLSHSGQSSWTEYAWRRLFRIYPPFLVALLFFALVLPSTRLSFQWPHELTQFYTRIFLIFNLQASTYTFINSSFWSVAVESQLYLLYPFLLFAIRRVGWKCILCLAFVVEIGLRLPFSELSLLAPDFRFPFAITAGPLGYVFSWVIGVKVADDYIAGRVSAVNRIPMGVYLALLFVSLTFKPAAIFQFTMFAMVSACCIGLLTQEKPVLNVAFPSSVSSHLAFVGSMSYSFYLIHQPLLNLAPQFAVWLNGGGFVHPTVKLLCCLGVYPLILVLSHLMYVHIEIPSINAGKWFLNYRSSAGGQSLKIGSV